MFIFSAVASFCELGCFALCSFAFGITSLPAIVVGYVAATMFAMVSITPQGVGFAEAAIVLFMCAYSVEAAAATAAGIVYRGLVFWLPFAIGAVLINRTKSFGHSDRKSKRKKKVAEQQLPVFDENGQLINQLVEPCVQSNTNDDEVASK